MRVAPLVFASVLAGLAACAEAPEAKAPRVGMVTIAFTKDPDLLPFDPRGARLLAATSELTRLVGHPVVFQLDAAILPEWQSSFESALIESVENVAKDLAALKERDPGALGHGASLLARIECKYSAIARDHTAHLDAGAKVLTVTLPPRANGYGPFVPRGAVERELLNEYETYVDRLYASADPDRVPAGERAAYFEYLTGYRPSRHVETDLSTVEKLSSDPEAVTVQKVLRLFDLAGNDAELRAKVTRWLVRKGGYFTREYMDHPSIVQAAAASSPWHRAEAGWVRWMTGSFASLPPEDKLTLSKTVFVKGFDRDRAPGSPRHASFAFPGLDLFAFGLAIADEWARAGHPMQETKPPISPLEEQIVCPHPKNESGNRSLGPRCDYDWYEYSLDREATTKRLVEAVIARNDRAFTEVVFVNVLRAPLPVAIGVWRALEPHEPSWRTATVILAEERAEVSDRPTLLDESRRLWRAYPDRRGAVLDLIVHLDPYEHDEVGWDHFEQTFGSRAGQADFASYLDQGAQAMRLAPVAWPALGKGWSRAQLIVPRLDRFVDDRESSQQMGHPYKTVGGIVRRLCEESNAPDLALMNAWIRQRVAAHPAEIRYWADIIEESGKCAVKAPPRPPARPNHGDVPRGGPRDPWNHGDVPRDYHGDPPVRPDRTRASDRQ